MARIRTIKPEFFTSEDIVSLTPLARILYIGLWCEADREGRLNWKPRTLKMKYLPADDADILELCDELVNLNLVLPYEVDGRQFAVLSTFKKHQSINIREAQSVIPEPPPDLHVHACEKDAWSVTREVRETVLARDGFKCVRCNSEDHLQIDHIFPRSIGGTNALTNLRVLCRSCNAGRPVAGKALLDDLRKDGLSMSDMERTCMHMQAHGEGKGREGKGKEEEGKEEPPRKRSAPNSAIPKPDDVDQQTWADWLSLRKAKRAPVTETVVKGARDESVKAGMTLDAFLQVWCRRGSQGLEAGWLKPEERNTQSRAPTETAYQRSMRERMQVAAPEFARKDPSKPMENVIDFFAIEVPAQRLEIGNEPAASLG